MLIKNKTITPVHGKQLLLDIHAKNDGQKKPIIIFSHGFKGFKDWGHWGLMGDYLADNGFVFVKYNFSHNGTTLDNPLEFDDLEAFGHNNFSKELDDLDAVLDWITTDNEFDAILEKEDITIIGHSRGGATNIIKGHIDARVKNLVTWASVSRVNYAWKKASFVGNWKKNGVVHMRNGRTNQDMPVYFQLYENCVENLKKFDVELISKSFRKPFLILHGEDDPAVSVSSAKRLNKWFEHSILKIIDGADHVFNGRHPYNEEKLPDASLILLKETIDFIKSSPT